MRTFDVVPLEGIPPIHLGVHKTESRRAMNSPFTSFEKVPGAAVDAYIDATLQVFFATNDTVNYIELTNSHETAATLFGQDVFATPAHELISRFSEIFDLFSDDGGYSYVSRSLSLGLWRPVLPESPDDQDSMFFQTVGVGTHGYYTSAA